MINLEKAREAKRNKALAKQQNYYFQKNRLFKKYNFKPLLDIAIGNYEAKLAEVVEVKAKTPILIMIFQIGKEFYITTRNTYKSREQSLAVNLLELNLITEEDCNESLGTLLNKYNINSTYIISVFTHSLKGKSNPEAKTSTIEYHSIDLQAELLHNETAIDQKRADLDNGYEDPEEETMFDIIEGGE